MYLCAVFSYLLQCLLSEDMFCDIFLYPPRQRCATLFSVIPLFSFKLSSFPSSQSVKSCQFLLQIHPVLYASTFPISSLAKLQSVLISLCRNLLTSLLYFCSDHYIQQSKGSLTKKTQIRTNHVTLLPLKPIASDPVLDLCLKDLASVCLLEFIFLFSLLVHYKRSVCSGH